MNLPTVAIDTREKTPLVFVNLPFETGTPHALTLRSMAERAHRPRAGQGGPRAGKKVLPGVAERSVPSRSKKLAPTESIFPHD